jgi:hypothetical protein
MSYKSLIEEYIEHAAVADEIARRCEGADLKESWQKIAAGYREMAQLRQGLRTNGEASKPLK